MTQPGIDGGRYLIGIEDHLMRDIARVLAEHYGPEGYKIPTGDPRTAPLKVAALFDKTARLALNDLSNPQDIDNGPVVEIFGSAISHTPRDDAMADSLIGYGLVKHAPRT